ncbi:Rpn family recombination-promoting nuclease/putative transposase [Bernardetia sp.]|uniref:Rpn family recombination-promoting nuclease/putative transposase n=1 Tax=Bernardetia sp. TaxID=1937974 RepID=UPI0025C3ED00|nr:Rpn family recombination-promoting nuclease/putative transposase [Bernardetia sp.]
MSTKERYLNPFTDFGFKKLFGTEVNKDLLIHFLNAVLPDNVEISELTYLKTEHLGHSALDRKVVYDLYCESPDGEKFIVELQKARQKFFKERTIFYSTFPIQEQAQQGDWDFELKAVYSVSILNFLIDDNSYATKQQKRIEKAPVKSVAKLIDVETKEVFYDKLTYVQIYIPLFDKAEEELETIEDKWFYVIQNLQRFQNRPVALQERIFDKVFATAEIAMFDKQERMAYEDSLKYYRDIKNVIDTAEEKGIAKGRKEGKEEGKKEKEIEIIKNGLSEGLDLTVLSKITNLSLEEVKEIVNSLEK